jgi:hypothetical protein
MSSDRRLTVFGEQIVEGFDKEGLQRGAGAQLLTIWKTHRRMSRVCCMEPPILPDTH